MFNKDKMVSFESESKVQDVVDALSKLPPNMSISFCGQPYGYLHVDSDENVASFDTDSLEDAYDED